MELLCPAGGQEALHAAIENGADAVYLGFTAFGARSYAGNFNRDELKAALDYAHERERSIYVTVNTLVKDAELSSACHLLEMLCTLGADAAIVQDLGLARIARTRFPELVLHASTQMTVHNAQGAGYMRDLGFTRVVPARECPLPEVKLMADTGIEIEAFVHGALCTSVSGQCLFSSFVGGRSGNRGRCAQPCRLPYTMADGTKGYLLSPKDLMLLDRIGEMRDAGVYSLKIEGRMKRPEYVAVVTRIYREALDCAQQGITYHPNANTIEELRQIFNRGGFTEGYAMGQNNAALMSWDKPNHFGVPLGVVSQIKGQFARVKLDKPIVDGDGLQFKGKSEIDVQYSGNDLDAGDTALVRLTQTENVRAGDRVCRITSEAQMRTARESYASCKDRIPVNMSLKAEVSQLPELAVSDGTHKITVKGTQAVGEAIKSALNLGSVRRQLEKTGDTPYVLQELTFIGENAFMPASGLNDLRRTALAVLKEARQERPPIGISDYMPTMAYGQPSTPILIAQAANVRDARTLLDAGADLVYWRPDDYRTVQLTSSLKGIPADDIKKIVFMLPQMAWSSELDELARFVNARTFAGVMLANAGQLACDLQLPLLGDAPLNVTNAQAAGFLFERRVSRVTLSQELSGHEMSETVAHGGNFEVIAYGKAQLMLLSHCTERVKQGDCVQDGACARCVNRDIDRTLIDRKGFTFTQSRERLEHGCFVRLNNGITTDMARRFDLLRALNVSIRCQFTVEPLAEQLEVIAAYRQVMDGGVDPRPDQGVQLTYGHLMRGVE